MALSSCSGGDKNQIPDGSGGDKNPIDGGSGKNRIMGRPIDHGFYEALWQLIYEALGIIIPQNRTPDRDAGFLEKPSPEKPPPHPKTLQVVLDVTTAKARSPVRRRKKRLRDYGTVVHSVHAKKARKVEGKQEKRRVRPEVYAGTMRRVLVEEVHRYFNALEGIDGHPQDPVRPNLREYLPFMIQQAGKAGPERGPPRSAPPVARCYFRVVARAARPDLLEPPPELQEYLQEVVTQEVRNLFHAEVKLGAMYSDDSYFDFDDFDDFDDVEYVDDSDDPTDYPGDGGDAAGSSMGVQV